MKRTENYIIRELEEEYLILPTGKRTETETEAIVLSETAGFIYLHAAEAETAEQLAEIVAKEYGIAPEEVLDDVRTVVDALQKRGLLE